MIKYNLKCNNKHEFESWFSDSSEFDKLNKNAVIMLDDAKRKNEQDAIKLWLEEYSSFSYEYINNDKGLAILRKKNA